MMAWLASGGAVVAMGVVYSTVTSLPVLRRLQGSRQGEGRRSSGPGWLASFLSGCLFALAGRPLIASLHLSTHWLILSLWLLLFVLGFLLSMIEARAFTDGPSPVRVRDVIGAMAASAVAASVAGCLIKAPSPGSLSVNLEQWIDTFGWTGLVVRLLGAAVAFMVAYCVIGSVAWRFVRPFYADPKLGLRLRIPSGRLVVLLQLGRGLLAVVALAPLIASLSAHGFDWWARFAFALAVTSGVIPLLGAAGWPTYLRIVHGVEIVVFDLVYAFALWRILGV
jgi:hypothetical protein